MYNKILIELQLSFNGHVKGAYQIDNLHDFEDFLRNNAGYDNTLVLGPHYYEIPSSWAINGTPLMLEWGD